MTVEAIVAKALEKAQRTLEFAQSSLRQADTEGACHRAYYAMFHAAHAALWMIEKEEAGSIIKSHGGLTSAFGQHLVKTGVLEAEHGRAISQVLKIRLLADYTADPPSEADARTAVTMAEAFVAAVQGLVGKSEQR